MMGWRDNIAGKIPALHTVDLGLILSTTYGTLSTFRSDLLVALPGVAEFVPSAPQIPKLNDDGNA